MLPGTSRVLLLPPRERDASDEPEILPTFTPFAGLNGERTFVDRILDVSKARGFRRRSVATKSHVATPAPITSATPSAASPASEIRVRRLRAAMRTVRGSVSLPLRSVRAPEPALSTGTRYSEIRFLR